MVSLVIFIDNDEALVCDKRIELLRTELNLPVDYEFHFSRNTRRVKLAFLEAVSRYNFGVITVTIDKDPAKLFGDGFGIKSSFYKYASQKVLTNALPYLDHATLIIDKSSNNTFQGELQRYLRRKLIDEDGTKSSKFKSQHSHRNNLLQLVDYCASLENRRLQRKPDWREYHKYLATKEVSRQIWPK